MYGCTYEGKWLWSQPPLFRDHHPRLLETCVGRGESHATPTSWPTSLCSCSPVLLMNSTDRPARNHCSSLPLDTQTTCWIFCFDFSVGYKRRDIWKMLKGAKMPKFPADEEVETETAIVLKGISSIEDWFLNRQKHSWSSNSDGEVTNLLGKPVDAPQ